LNPPWRPSLGYARYALIVLFAVNVLNYVDRLIVSALLGDIQTELHLNDQQGGLLYTAFILMFALAAVPLGRWADAHVRKNVVAAGVLLWSAATITSAAARRFITLFLARACVGIGEASVVPAGLALISDYFPRTHRVRAISVFGAAMIVGGTVGLVVGKLIGVAIGWRHALVAAGSPGLLLALWVYSLREPPPGAQEEVSEATRAATPPALSTLLRIPTLAIMAVGIMLLTGATNGLIHWLMEFMERVRHVPQARAALIGGGPAMAGCLLGVLCSGVVTERLAQRYRTGLVASIAASILVSLPFLLAFLLVDVQWIYLVALFFAGFCLSWAIAPVGALVHSLVEPRLRGAAVGIFTLFTHLGDAVSPYLIGLVSDLCGGRAQPEALRSGLLVTPAFALLGGLVCLLALRTVARDAENMVQRLRDAAKRAPEPENL